MMNSADRVPIHLVAWIDGAGALSPTRVPGHAIRTYSGLLQSAGTPGPTKNILRRPDDPLVRGVRSAAVVQLRSSRMWRIVAAALSAAALVLVAVLPVRAQPASVTTRIGPVAVARFAGGLAHPWGMAFLPDGRLLVTERPGRLRIVSPNGPLSEPLAGVPQVFAQGQGGLLDVALDPDFGQNRLVYLSFAEPGADGASTALGRGRLADNRADNRIEGFQIIFRQEPKVSGPNHFGGRIVFSPDGTLFLTMGERFKFDPAQELASDLGKIVRLNRDGSIPRDNPFVGRPNAR